MLTYTDLLVELPTLLKNKAMICSSENIWVYILLAYLCNYYGVVHFSLHCDCSWCLFQGRLRRNGKQLPKTCYSKHICLANFLLHQLPFLVKPSCWSDWICRLIILQGLVELRHPWRVLEIMELTRPYMVFKTCLLPNEKKKVFMKLFAYHSFHNFSNPSWICNSFNF